MISKTIEKVDLNNLKHCDALVELLNEYMKDKVGAGKSMPKELAACRTFTAHTKKLSLCHGEIYRSR